MIRFSEKFKKICRSEMLWYVPRVNWILAQQLVLRNEHNHSIMFAEVGLFGDVTKLQVWTLTHLGNSMENGSYE